MPGGRGGAGGGGGGKPAAFPLRSQSCSKMPESRHLGHLPSRHRHFCRGEAVFRADSSPSVGEANRMDVGGHS